MNATHPILNEDGIAPILISRHPDSAASVAQFAATIPPADLGLFYARAPQRISVLNFTNGYSLIRLFAGENDPRPPVAAFFVYRSGLVSALTDADKVWGIPTQPPR